MLNIWTLKKNEEGKKKRQKIKSAEIRVRKDLTELDLPSSMRTEFSNLPDLPDTIDALHFKLIITPNEGMYKGGEFVFTVDISEEYPHEPPKVKCTQKIFHPNIDLDGNVCLNVLREDWKPVLSLNAVCIGLYYLFLEPNADDPLNKEAAEELLANREAFALKVKSAMKGGTIKGTHYDDVEVHSSVSSKAYSR